MTTPNDSVPPRFDTLAARVLALLPTGADTLRDDLRRNLHAALAAAFARMNLVTQEEFEVQSGVLARTRAKLEALERRVRELEQASAPASSTSPP